MAAGQLSEETLAPIRETFFQECGDLLAELEAGLLTLQNGARDPEIIDTVFRAAHSIKGGAGAFGFAVLVRIAHAFEAALDAVRDKRVTLDAELLRLLFAGADALADVVRATREGRGDAAAEQIDSVTAALAALAPDAAVAAVDEDGFLDFEFTPKPVSVETPAVRRWLISLRPHATFYARAGEPLLLLRDLARLGEISTTLDCELLPALEDLEPEAAYLAWSVVLATTADEAEIRDLFAFVEGDCDVDVARLPSDAEAAGIPQVAPPPDGATPDEARLAAKPELAPTIRVDLERVDRLVNLVGELVINQAMLAQRLADAGVAETAGLQPPLDDLEHLTREIQDGVMAIRAQPVKAVFQRLTRVAREAEAATGKLVKLVIVGEETEVDRTVIERLTDPLTHMVRNAIDHGLETPAERRALGKPEAGVVRISAEHRGGRIVITVADDGRGLDRSAVMRTATRRGLIAPDAELADEEIDNLIFAPGFSTADEASTLSGRGVGMDVVQRGVQDLGGRILVASRPGDGCSFTLTLPLTLAVLDGMVISIAGYSLVAPLTSLIESTQPREADVRRLGPNGWLLRFRGEHMPLIDLGFALGYRPQPMEPSRGIALIVHDDLGGRAALLVDEILGQRQVVIKSLEANYQAVPGVSAATILGDGRVALIVDVGAIATAYRPAPDAVLRTAAG